ncbi:probable small intestine urate exporter isoform X1 [Equus caballus]|uniref:Solute carrier family 17 member 4 n=2 Tax=Equus caballus TaxID=9796 RepID=F7C271_HORSE|nr:probable small intestine urate exporter [Equus caballus]
MSTRAEAKATVGDISNDGNLNMAQVQTSRKGFCSVRHGLAFTLYFCNLLIYTQKMSMSIAIPAMVNNTALSSPANASTERPPTDSQDNQNETLKEFKAVAPMYDWSPEIQGIILSSLNYGSFLAPIPIGYVAGIFGAKYLVGVGLFISSVLTLFIPLVTDAGATFLIVLQIVQGIFQVIVNTSQYSIWVKWAPPQERSQLISIAMSGSALGSCIILLVGGLLCQTVGWPYIFYIFGGIGCACSFLWFPLVYDDPANHPFISTGEREYIMCSLAQQDYSSDWSLPIKAMIKSLPLWSILVSYFSEFWLFNIFVAYMPTYINSVLQVNLRDSGILSALPFLFGSICMILGGLLADFLLSRKILRLVTIRKLFTAMGVIFPSVLCVSLPWVSSSLITTMAFLVLFTAISSLSEAGSFVNILDIAPRYVTFLRGLLQVSYHISGAISPTVTGIFLSQDSEFGWRNIFLLSAAINTSGLVFYLIFGQAEVQEWAKEQTITHL